MNLRPQRPYHHWVDRCTWRLFGFRYHSGLGYPSAFAVEMRVFYIFKFKLEIA